VTVLVGGDVPEALGEPRHQALLLVVVEHEVLAGERQGHLDEHVVPRDEADLDLEVRGTSIRRRPVLTRRSSTGSRGLAALGSARLVASRALGASEQPSQAEPDQ
jgi:hypothetical protein